MPTWTREMTVTGACALLLGVLAWLAPTGILAPLVIMFILFFQGHALGVKWDPRSHPALAALLGIVGLLAGMAVVETVFYYIGIPLSSRADLLAFALALLGLQIATIGEARARKRDAHATELESTEMISLGWSAATIFPALIACGFVLRHAATSATSEAIRTPWPLMPHGTLAAIALLGLLAILAAWRSGSAAVTATVSALALLSVTMIAPLLYTLAFGFDGFLHRASEQVLLTTGVLHPKPPYYIGQYVFVTFLSRLFSAQLRGFDVFLVPLTIALVPFQLLTSLKSLPLRRWTIALLPILLFLAPFIATTPQSFAYILGILAVLCAIAVRERATSVLPSLTLGAWALATHPLAGLPFVGATLAILLLDQPILKWLTIVATTVSVPFAFWVNSLRSGLQISWNLKNLLNIGPTLLGTMLPPATHVALWADWASFVTFLAPFLLLSLAIVAGIVDKERRPLWRVFIWLGIGMTLSGLFLATTGDFTFLIGYERGNYADRLYVIAQLFLLLPALIGAAFVLQRASRRPSAGFVTLLLFLAAWMPGQAYDALPRYDAAVSGHGWSVGRADFEAVRDIDRDANGQPYTVLANQSVSAAAVETFGFKRYAGDVFYYPIPTGGPLYDVFLRAVGSDPSPATLREAASLGQSSLVYVVLNDYWWDADHVAEELASSTDQVREFEQGKTRVYRFDASAAKNR